MVGIQTTVNQRAALGSPGQLYDMDNKRIVTLTNANTVLQQWTVTVNAAADEVYFATFTNIFGEALTAQFNQGAIGIIADKVAGMVAAINNTPVLSSQVIAVATAANTYTVTARLSNIQGIVTTDVNSTPALTTAPLADAGIDFGRGIVIANVAGTNGRLPNSAPSIQQSTVLFDAAAAGNVTSLTVNGVNFTQTAGGGGETANFLRNFFINAINASADFIGVLRAFDNGAGELIIVAETTDAFTVIQGAGHTAPALVIAAPVVASAGDVIYGVTVRSHTQANDTKYDLAGVSLSVAGSDGYAVGAAMNVLTKGVVWVNSENGANAGDPVFVRGVIGAVGQVLGAFRSAAVAGETVPVPNARFITAGGAGALVAVELR